MEELLTKKKFKKGETILTEGMESYDVYVVMDGEAEVVKTCFDTPIGIRTFKKGDVFGASGLIAGTPRFATVIAKTDLEAGMMYRDDFLSIVEKLPPQVREMMKFMVSQLRAAYEVSAELAIHVQKMLVIKETMESIGLETRKEYLGEVPEIIKSVIVSTEHGLTEITHNFSKLATQLEKTVDAVDNLFTQSIGPRP